jgi:hypothetical protein
MFQPKFPAVEADLLIGKLEANRSWSRSGLSLRGALLPISEAAGEVFSKYDGYGNRDCLPRLNLKSALCDRYVEGWRKGCASEVVEEIVVERCLQILFHHG